MELWCSQDSSRSYHVFVLDPGMMKSFKALSESWRSIVRFVEEKEGSVGLAHPAVKINRVDGTVTNGSVNKAFMEKSELRWWSLRELKEIIKHKPDYKEVFRPYFLDFLHCVVATVECETKRPSEKVSQNQQVVYGKKRS